MTQWSLGPAPELQKRKTHTVSMTQCGLFPHERTGWDLLEGACHFLKRRKWLLKTDLALNDSLL